MEDILKMIENPKALMAKRIALCEKMQSLENKHTGKVNV